MNIKFDHFVIASSNLERSDDFYRRVFDAKILTLDKVLDTGSAAPSPEMQRAFEAFRVYRLGTMQLNVHGPGLNAPAALLASRPVVPGNSDFCFEWEGPITGAVAHLAQQDVPVETGPRDSAGSKGRGTSVYFRDPDGSLLEFISYAA